MREIVGKLKYFYLLLFYKDLTYTFAAPNTDVIYC
jgi:hypothetical protein